MKIQKRLSLRYRFQSFVSVLFLGMTFSHSARAQEKRPSSSPLASSTEAQSPETARARCKATVKCFDAGPYIVTVIDIIEGDVPGYRKARLALQFNNLTDEALVLGYQSRSSFMVDNFKDYYSCCRTDTGEDTSAIGIGIDRDDKIGSQFTVGPRASNSASFDLWRHRPPDQPASYYHFYIMIDEIDPSGKTVLKHTPLFFKNLPPSTPEVGLKR